MKLTIAHIDLNNAIAEADLRVAQGKPQRDVCSCLLAQAGARIYPGQRVISCSYEGIYFCNLTKIFLVGLKNRRIVKELVLTFDNCIVGAFTWRSQLNIAAIRRHLPIEVEAQIKLKKKP